jgi:transcriptional regulator with XRE-family HTH domain
MTFRAKLLELMAVREWSVSDLARESGLTFPTVRSYTSTGKNRRLPTLVNAIKLAEALGVSLEEFKDCTDLVKPDKDDTSDKT